MKKKDLLNEIMGVPKALESWVDYFTMIATGMAKGITLKDEIEEGPISYVNDDGEEVQEIAYKGEAHMDGKEVMQWVMKLGGFTDLKDLLSDPNFKSFPLYNPEITIKLIFIPDELWQKEVGNKSSDTMNASHGWSPLSTKLSKLGGNNLVFVGQLFTFDGLVPISWLENFDSDKFRKTCRTTISHELTHAFEAYMRIKQTGSAYSGRETFLNVAARVMSDNKYPQWREFLHLVYLHLSFEINARVTQLYYEMKENGVSSKEEFLTVLKKSSVWEEIKMLENFNAENFMNSFTTVKIKGFEEMMNDIGKQMARQQQGLPSIQSKNTPQEGMTHLIDGWNLTLQKLNKEFTEQGYYKGKLMDLVPAAALKDPKVFFKFFEERFHRKGEVFRKKALRLASLVLDEKNQEKLDK